MVTLRERAWAIVAGVVDPEIPVLTIEDLGVLRDVEVSGDTVEVVITPTYSGCPAMNMIAVEIETALAQAGIPATTRLVLAPAWTTDWMSDAGVAKLRAYGIAPPVRGAAVVCPLCSGAAEKLSEFGSTSCKALWRCLRCREPFDAFKCH
jgi:ring-1,2-phenylacetyl-CoA epoxidase subunit PaaD